MDNTQELRTLSLCTGYGGIERGIESTGQPLRALAHVEIEAYAIANLVSKMEKGELVPCPVWTNLKTLPLEPFRGAVDLLTGGYPCQPFSVAGRRLGTEDPRHLWPWICRIIDGIMPRMCFFENVDGHVSQGLQQVLADLESRGYKTSWGIFSAAEAGAPHQRKRVFILADSQHQRHVQQQPTSRLWEGLLEDRSLTDRGENPILANSISGGVRGGRSSEERRDDCKGIQGNEGKRHELRSQIEGRDTPAREELADSDSKGRHRDIFPSGHEQALSRAPLPSYHGFPRRPGEAQHKWENPRIEPKMGRAVNGPSDRVDRLRLLGNGVVPQTAALAWSTLTRPRNK